MKKKDIILIATLLLVAIVILLVYRHITKPTDDRTTEIVVTVHNVEYGRYSIHEDQVIEIPTEHGTNVLVIKDGKAKMKSAGCPDQVCVKHSPIHYNHDMIICMPNEIIVEVYNGEASDLDVISE